jgi:outer membrane protein with glycine zipper
MTQRILAAVLLVFAAMTTQPATAQDALGGAILGGAAGAIVGGAVTGRAGGAAVGAIIGATTGAIIADEGRRNSRGYYAWHQGCYIQRRDGSWVRVHPRYCY